ncbi:hypothetical protein MKW98_018123 [Papaver atlanticum]|uniref:Uncharacterized protein n=1 Tax=Papaver atlanticum TaxID=357466 RepID=A0AAD4S9W1_9MAGN|nr:hypothetical protein MKW98_018123 [Papaver atlanticum]
MDVFKTSEFFGRREFSLRVVDGSTFSISPGTNPQTTLMMMGRYVGVKILEERQGGVILYNAGVFVHLKGEMKGCAITRLGKECAPSVADQRNVPIQ